MANPWDSDPIVKSAADIAAGAKPASATANPWDSDAMVKAAEQSAPQDAAPKIATAPNGTQNMAGMVIPIPSENGVVPRQVGNALASGVQNVAHGASFGLDDYAAAGLSAASSYLGRADPNKIGAKLLGTYDPNPQGDSFMDKFSDALHKFHGQRTADSDAHPVASTLGQGVGNVIGAVEAAPAMAAKLPWFLAGTGALQGAANNFDGTAASIPGAVGQAVLQGGLNAAGPSIGKGLGNVADSKPVQWLAKKGLDAAQGYAIGSAFGHGTAGALANTILDKLPGASSLPDLATKSVLGGTSFAGQQVGKLGNFVTNTIPDYLAGKVGTAAENAMTPGAAPMSDAAAAFLRSMGGDPAVYGGAGAPVANAVSEARNRLVGEVKPAYQGTLGAFSDAMWQHFTGGNSNPPPDSPNVVPNTPSVPLMGSQSMSEPVKTIAPFTARFGDPQAVMQTVAGVDPQAAQQLAERHAEGPASYSAGLFQQLMTNKGVRQALAAQQQSTDDMA